MKNPLAEMIEDVRAAWENWCDARGVEALHDSEPDWRGQIADEWPRFLMAMDQALSVVRDEDEDPA